MTELIVNETEKKRENLPMRLKRMFGFYDKNNKFHVLGKSPALARMTEKVTCPCHQRSMIIRVADGQAINLRKECMRQKANGVRWNEQN